MKCKYKVPTFDDDNRDRSFKIGDKFPHRSYRYMFTWWSWHPIYPWWSKSCWGANTVEEAEALMSAPRAGSMKAYANVLVKDDIDTRELTVIKELPCEEIEMWNKIPEERHEEALKEKRKMGR